MCTYSQPNPYLTRGVAAACRHSHQSRRHGNLWGHSARCGHICLYAWARGGWLLARTAAHTYKQEIHAPPTEPRLLPRSRDCIGFAPSPRIRGSRALREPENAVSAVAICSGIGRTVAAKGVLITVRRRKSDRSYKCYPYSDYCRPVFELVPLTVRHKPVAIAPRARSPAALCGGGRPGSRTRQNLCHTLL